MCVRYSGARELRHEDTKLYKLFYTLNHRIVESGRLTYFLGGRRRGIQPSGGLL